MSTNHRTYAEITTELAGVLVEIATELAAEREAHTATKEELDVERAAHVATKAELARARERLQQDLFRPRGGD